MKIFLSHKCNVQKKSASLIYFHEANNRGWRALNRILCHSLRESTLKQQRVGLLPLNPRALRETRAARRSIVDERRR